MRVLGAGMLHGALCVLKTLHLTSSRVTGLMFLEAPAQRREGVDGHLDSRRRQEPGAAEAGAD